MPNKENYSPVLADLKALMSASGAVAWGITSADCTGDIDPDGERYRDRRLYESWLNRGDFARMDYMLRNNEARFNPVRLLENEPSDPRKSKEDRENQEERHLAEERFREMENREERRTWILSAAFSYHPGGDPSHGRTPIALYGRGRDYHEEIGERLTDVASEMQKRYGGNWRVAVDTLPLRERFWAVKAGIGYCGMNGALIVPGYGSMVVLGEIITDLPLQPFSTINSAMPADCGNCGRCVRSCPGGAINTDGTIDCRRCLSYLTIEHRGDFEPDMTVMRTPEGRSTLFGCDICLRVCPHNRDCPATEIEAFGRDDRVAELTAEKVVDMAPDKLGALLRGTALKRARVGGLKRNARNMLESQE